MVFILSSRWLSGFFYHHQNRASAFRLVLLLPTISPFLMMIKTICLKYLQSNILQVDFLVALFGLIILKFFSPCFDHMKKSFDKEAPPQFRHR